MAGPRCRLDGGRRIRPEACDGEGLREGKTQESQGCRERRNLATTGPNRQRVNAALAFVPHGVTRRIRPRGTNPWSEASGRSSMVICSQVACRCRPCAADWRMSGQSQEGMRHREVEATPVRSSSEGKNPKLRPVERHRGGHGGEKGVEAGRNRKDAT